YAHSIRNASSRLPRSLKSCGVAISPSGVLDTRKTVTTMPKASDASMKLIATSGGYIVEYQSASSDISQSMAAKLTVTPSAGMATMLKRWSLRNAVNRSFVRSCMIDRLRSMTDRTTHVVRYTTVRTRKNG